MQKGILKGFAAGLLAGLSIVNGITYAANYSKNLEIYYRDIRIVADGKEVHPADAKGNLVEPFISGGTTYLPRTRRGGFAWKGRVLGRSELHGVSWRYGRRA